MNKPYIVCHMMMALDGRIDCAMTEQLPGTNEYYSTLDSFKAPTHLSGRVTAELEMALPGRFISKTNTPLGQKAFYKSKEAEGYDVVVDTHGILLWEDQINAESPILVLTSENVSQEYLDYLKENHVSWIACGKERIDLKRACEILVDDFGVRRMAVVGGGHINAGFLEAGLLDEISVLIGAGIDGRGGMSAVFDGLAKDKPVTPLKLTQVETFESGAVWIRYKIG